MMKLKKKLGKKQLLVLALIIVVFLGLLMGQLISAKKSKKSSNIETFEVSEEAPIVFSGQVKTKEKQTVFHNEALGEIEKMAVEDGQKVEVGQELVRYKNKDLSAQVGEQERLLERTKKNLAQAAQEVSTNQAIYQKEAANASSYQTKVNDLKDQMVQQELAVQKAQEERAKLEQSLVENPDQPVQELEEVHVDPTLAREVEKYSSLQMEAEAKKQEAAAKKDSYQAQKDQLAEAQADLEAQLKNLKDKEYLVIKAEISGIVKINHEVLTDSTLTSPLIEIICEEAVVTATASEYDYEEVEVGKEVSVVPNNSDQKVKGIIVDKDLLPQSSVVTSGQSEAVKYPFTVKLDQMIPYGFSVQVQLSSGKIFIPEDYVNEEDGDLTVFLLEDGVARKKKIEGDLSEGFYLLQSGLEPKDVLVKKVGGSLEEGEEIETDDQPIETE